MHKLQSYSKQARSLEKLSCGTSASVACSRKSFSHRAASAKSAVLEPSISVAHSSPPFQALYRTLYTSSGHVAGSQDGRIAREAVDVASLALFTRKVLQSLQGLKTAGEREIFLTTALSRLASRCEASHKAAAAALGTQGRSKRAGAAPSDTVSLTEELADNAVALLQAGMQQAQQSIAEGALTPASLSTTAKLLLSLLQASQQAPLLLSALHCRGEDGMAAIWPALRAACQQVDTFACLLVQAGSVTGSSSSSGSSSSVGEGSLASKDTPVLLRLLSQRHQYFTGEASIAAAAPQSIARMLQYVEASVGASETPATGGSADTLEQTWDALMLLQAQLPSSSNSVALQHHSNQTVSAVLAPALEAHAALLRCKQKMLEKAAAAVQFSHVASSDREIAWAASLHSDAIVLQKQLQQKELLPQSLPSDAALASLAASILQSCKAVAWQLLSHRQNSPVPSPSGSFFSQYSTQALLQLAGLHVSCLQDATSLFAAFSDAPPASSLASSSPLSLSSSSSSSLSSVKSQQAVLGLLAYQSAVSVELAKRFSKVNADYLGNGALAEEEEAAARTLLQLQQQERRKIAAVWLSHALWGGHGKGVRPALDAADATVAEALVDIAAPADDAATAMHASSSSFGSDADSSFAAASEALDGTGFASSSLSFGSAAEEGALPGGQLGGAFLPDIGGSLTADADTVGSAAGTAATAAAAASNKRSGRSWGSGSSRRPASVTESQSFSSSPSPLSPLPTTGGAAVVEGEYFSPDAAVQGLQAGSSTTADILAEQGEHRIAILRHRTALHSAAEQYLAQQYSLPAGDGEAAVLGQAAGSGRAAEGTQAGPSFSASSSATNSSTASYRSKIASKAWQRLQRSADAVNVSAASAQLSPYWQQRAVLTVRLLDESLDDMNPFSEEEELFSAAAAAAAAIPRLLGEASTGKGGSRRFYSSSQAERAVLPADATAIMALLPPLMSPSAEHFEAVNETLAALNSLQGEEGSKSAGSMSAEQLQQQWLQLGACSYQAVRAAAGACTAWMLRGITEPAEDVVRLQLLAEKYGLASGTRGFYAAATRRLAGVGANRNLLELTPSALLSSLSSLCLSWEHDRDAMAVLIRELGVIGTAVHSEDEADHAAAAQQSGDGAASAAAGHAQGKQQAHADAGSSNSSSSSSSSGGLFQRLTASVKALFDPPTLRLGVPPSDEWSIERQRLAAVAPDIHIAASLLDASAAALGAADGGMQAQQELRQEEAFLPALPSIQVAAAGSYEGGGGGRNHLPTLTSGASDSSSPLRSAHLQDQPLWSQAYTAAAEGRLLMLEGFFSQLRTRAGGSMLQDEPALQGMPLTALQAFPPSSLLPSAAGGPNSADSCSTSAASSHPPSSSSSFSLGSAVDEATVMGSLLRLKAPLPWGLSSLDMARLGLLVYTLEQAAPGGRARAAAGGAMDRPEKSTAGRKAGSNGGKGGSGDSSSQATPIARLIPAAALAAPYGSISSLLQDVPVPLLLALRSLQKRRQHSLGDLSRKMLLLGSAGGAASTAGAAATAGTGPIASASLSAASGWGSLPANDRSFLLASAVSLDASLLPLLRSPWLLEQALPSVVDVLSRRARQELEGIYRAEAAALAQQQTQQLQQQQQQLGHGQGHKAHAAASAGSASSSAFSLFSTSRSSSRSSGSGSSASLLDAESSAALLKRCQELKASLRSSARSQLRSLLTAGNAANAISAPASLHASAAAAPVGEEEWIGKQLPRIFLPWYVAGSSASVGSSGAVANGGGGGASALVVPLAFPALRLAVELETSDSLAVFSSHSAAFPAISSSSSSVEAGLGSSGASTRASQEKAARAAGGSGGGAGASGVTSSGAGMGMAMGAASWSTSHLAVLPSLHTMWRTAQLQQEGWTIVRLPVHALQPALAVRSAAVNGMMAASAAQSADAASPAAAAAAAGSSSMMLDQLLQDYLPAPLA